MNVKVELNKLMPGFDMFHPLSLALRFGRSYRMRDGHGVASLSLIKLPVRFTPDGVILAGHLPLGMSPPFLEEDDEEVPTLCVGFEGVQLDCNFTEQDWRAANVWTAAAFGWIPDQRAVMNMVAANLLPRAIQILTQWFEAFRHARHQLAQDEAARRLGANLGQTLIETQRIPDWEFHHLLCYRVTDDCNECWGWVPRSASGYMAMEEVDELPQIVQRYLSRGVDFTLTEMFHAEEALLDGDLPDAVVFAVTAVEGALTKFVRRERSIRGLSATKDFSLYDLLNNELIAMAPRERVPSPRLIAKLNSARKLRNKIVHGVARKIAYRRASSAVAAAWELMSYLNETS